MRAAAAGAVVATAVVTAIALAPAARAAPGEHAAAFGLARAAAEAPSGAAIGRYIVVLRDSADAAAVARSHGRAYGFEADHVYGHVLTAYAAKLPAAAAAAIAARPDVLYVDEDREVARASTQPPQFVTNGVRRIDGDVSSTRSGDGRGTVNVNVAVLDDGIDVDHPDLNVGGKVSCLSGGRNGVPDPWEPRDSHGTLVGGFIGARDNDFGAVGIAPGATLWGVEVLSDMGRGLYSEILCGLDWVAGTRADGDPGNDIQVVNMSLGGFASPGADTGACPASGRDGFHAAVCRVIAARIPIVASAGNDSSDLRNFAPATYDEVLAATAITDLDGRPGGLQPPTGACAMGLSSDGVVADDTAAFFSNFATLPEDRAHTVAAPGVCISSTYPGGLYATSTGTSFAAPLVTGMVALCIARGPCAGLSPTHIVQKIVGDGAAYNTSKRGSGYGFAGDPLRPDGDKYYGYLVRAGLY